MESLKENYLAGSKAALLDFQVVEMKVQQKEGKKAQELEKKKVAL
jgi:hypothetical protein